MDIYKKLKGDEKYNPFSQHFDSNLVESKILEFRDKFMDNKKELSKEGKPEFYFNYSFLCAALELNQISKSVFNIFKDFIGKPTFNFDLTLECLIALANRTYIIVSNKLENETPKELYLSYSLNHKTENNVNSKKEIPSISAMESQFDSLNTILNYLRHFETNPGYKKIEDEIELIENLGKIFLNSMVINILKGEYEDCVWNEGFITKIQNKYTFGLDEKEIILRQIGNLRFARITFELTFPILISYRKNKKQFKKNFKESKLNLFKRIKSVSISKGEIIYKLAKGTDLDEIWNILKFESEIEAFYSFIRDVKFPSNNLTISKCLRMIAAITNLIERVSKVSDQNDSIYTISDFGKFPIKIKKKSLQYYLEERTKYNKKEIQKFLSTYSASMTNRFSVWQSPLIERKDNYLVTLMPQSVPVISNLIDTILEKSRFHMDKRGLLFENHLTTEITKALNDLGYFYNIPKRKTFKSKTGCSEEIDLIIEFKNIILTAEVKCVKYAMEARNYSNLRKTLKQASKQIKRKTKFLEKHSSEFLVEIKGLEVKKIMSAVIIQFPQISGIEFDSIPILDFNLLLSYFKGGTYARDKIDFSSGEQIIQKVFEKKYYNDELSFNENFQEFLLKPYPVNHVLMKSSTINQKISPEGSTPEFYTINSKLPEKTG